MFFVLSKVLLFLTKPFTWILIFLLLGFFFKSKSWSTRSLRFSIILLLFFTNSVVFLEFARAWEIQGVNIQQVKTHDCAILLTGMAGYNNDLKRLELNMNGDRIWQTMDLYRRKKVRKILITGNAGTLMDKGLHEAQQLGEVLIRQGIPATDIIIEGKSENTFENAKESARMLRAKFPDLTRFLLITNGTHMRRSLACFKKQGLVCTPFSVRLHTGPQRDYFPDQYLIPRTETLFMWENLTKEWIGYISYSLMGYI